MVRVSTVRLHLVRLACAAVVATLGLLFAVERATAAPKPPNIVFILADDLGYADLSCFGQQKYQTPNIDRLAAEGMRFTQHYAGCAVCAPSRCVLMTGLHPGHSFVRNNREAKPEGQFPVPADTVTFPKLLQELGYVTGGYGKWGLGGPESTGRPLLQGFTHFYGINCQRVAHSHYPDHLWDDDRRVDLAGAVDGHAKFPVGADPTNPASFAQYTGQHYAPDMITAAALQFMRDNKDKPFLLYFPSIIPHVSLQVPKDSLAEYADKFPEEPYTGKQGYVPVFKPHATYAAMVKRLDRHVGQLLDLLKELKLDDNTIVVFSSDNGPVYERVGGADSEFFHSAGPLRGFKGSLYEGGVREPTIVRWPGHTPAGSTSDRVSGFEDWLPTLVEAAGGKSLVPSRCDGISLLPTLNGQPQAERPFLYREFAAYDGFQSVRIGDWKGIRTDLNPRQKKREPNRHIELYNLRSDVGETKDVSAEHPEIVAKIERIMQEQHTPSLDFPFPAIDAAAPASSAEKQ